MPICAKPGVKILCDCGGVHEVIETKGHVKNPSPFVCVLCEKELFVWEGANVGQVRLIVRPDLYRE